jgi:hypothetical protein
MANEPTRSTTIVKDTPQGPHLEGRYDDGIKSVFNESTGTWEGHDNLRDYDADKDAYVDPAAPKPAKKAAKKKKK